MRPDGMTLISPQNGKYVTRNVAATDTPAQPEYRIVRSHLARRVMRRQQKEKRQCILTPIVMETLGPINSRGPE